MLRRHGQAVKDAIKAKKAQAKDVKAKYKGWGALMKSKDLEEVRPLGSLFARDLLLTHPSPQFFLAGETRPGTRKVPRLSRLRRRVGDAAQVAESQGAPAAARAWHTAPWAQFHRVLLLRVQDPVVLKAGLQALADFLAPAATTLDPAAFTDATVISPSNAPQGNLVHHALPHAPAVTQKAFLFFVFLFLPVLQLIGDGSKPGVNQLVKLWTSADQTVQEMALRCWRATLAAVVALPSTHGTRTDCLVALLTANDPVAALVDVLRRHQAAVDAGVAFPPPPAPVEPEPPAKGGKAPKGGKGGKGGAPAGKDAVAPSEATDNPDDGAKKKKKKKKEPPPPPPPAAALEALLALRAAASVLLAPTAPVEVRLCRGVWAVGMTWWTKCHPNAFFALPCSS